jgi:hypothetical protein
MSVNITTVYPKDCPETPEPQGDARDIVLGAPLLNIAGQYETLDGLFKRRTTTANLEQPGIFAVEANTFNDPNYLAVTNGQIIPPSNLNLAADFFRANYTTWVAMTLPSSATWRSVTHGSGRAIAVAQNSNMAAYLEDGSTTWVTMTLPSIANWFSVTHGSGRAIAVAWGSNTAAYLEDGSTTWVTMTLPSIARLG